MAAEQAVQTAGELLAGTAQAFADLEEQAAALVLLVLHVQGQGQAVLQFGAELVQLHIFHALQPAAEVIHEGIHFGGGRIQRTQQEAQTLPELVPGFLHPFQHDAQPDGEARFGLAQAQDQGLGQRRVQTAGLQRGRRGTLGRGSRRGSGSGGKGRIGHGDGSALFRRGRSGGPILFRRGGSGSFRAFVHLERRFLPGAFGGCNAFVRMGSSGGSIRADVLVHLLLRHSRRVLSFGSRGRSIRPGRFFVTAENALPPAATGRRRFGIFFRSFADLVADRLIFRGIRSGFGLFFSHSVTGFSRAGGDHIVTGSLSRIDGIGPGRFRRQRSFFRFLASLHNGLSLGRRSFRFRPGLFHVGKPFFPGV